MQLGKRRTQPPQQRASASPPSPAGLRDGPDTIARKPGKAQFLQPRPPLQPMQGIQTQRLTIDTAGNSMNTASGTSPVFGSRETLPSLDAKMELGPAWTSPVPMMPGQQWATLGSEQWTSPANEGVPAGPSSPTQPGKTSAGPPIFFEQPVAPFAPVQGFIFHNGCTSRLGARTGRRSPSLSPPMDTPPAEAAAAANSLSLRSLSLQSPQQDATTRRSQSQFDTAVVGRFSLTPCADGLTMDLDD